MSTSRTSRVDSRTHYVPTVTVYEPFARGYADATAGDLEVETNLDVQGNGEDIERVLFAVGTVIGCVQKLIDEGRSLGAIELTAPTWAAIGVNLHVEGIS